MVGGNSTGDCRPGNWDGQDGRLRNFLFTYEIYIIPNKNNLHYNFEFVVL